MIVINPTEKCKYQAQKPKMIHRKSTINQCDTDEFENKLRKEIECMAEIKVLGSNITRANPKAIQNPIDMGVLYVGEDNQLHAVDVKENIPAAPTKVCKDIK